MKASEYELQRQGRIKQNAERLGARYAGIAKDFNLGSLLNCFCLVGCNGATYDHKSTDCVTQDSQACQAIQYT